jgi:hypothetical protein
MIAGASMARVTVNGVELYYEWHGPQDAPVLVLNARRLECLPAGAPGAVPGAAAAGVIASVPLPLWEERLAKRQKAV